MFNSVALWVTFLNSYTHGVSTVKNHTFSHTPNSFKIIVKLRPYLFLGVSRISDGIPSSFPSKLLSQNLEILCEPVSIYPHFPFCAAFLSLNAVQNLLCCVINSPYLFLSVTRCLEYLSSGENRAGCADFETSPETTFLSVYWRTPFESRVYMRCILTCLSCTD